MLFNDPLNAIKQNPNLSFTTIKDNVKNKRFIEKAFTTLLHELNEFA
jgi:hypothetical protein